MEHSCITTSRRSAATEDQTHIRLREDGILHVMWQPSTVITLEGARSAVEASLLTPGNRRLLLGMTATSFTSCARRHFCEAAGLAAIALVGEGPVDRVVAAFAYNARHPAGFFTSESAAIDWLGNFA